MSGLLSLLLIFVFGTTAIPEARPQHTVGSDDVKAILQRLDSELEKRDVYLMERHGVIDSLKSVIGLKDISDEARLECLLKLGDNYSTLNTDSALTFYTRGHELASAAGLDSIALRFNLRSATYLPLLAFITEAAKRFDEIDVNSVPDGLKKEYYDAARQMYFYIASYYINYPEIYEPYMKLSQEAQAQLIPFLEENSPRHMLNSGEALFYNHQYSRAKVILMQLLDLVQIEDNMYARGCHLLADIYKAQGDHNAYIYYLALSAIADTRGATLEVSSLQELGRLIYLNGDVSRAYEYLSTALSLAVECNAPLRIIQSAHIFPIIESAHKAELRKSDKRIYIVIGIMALLLVGLAITLYFLHGKNRQMNRMAVRLEEANSVKDIYISQFLSLCSIYMDKLNQFNKMVNRKITTGKIDDLAKLTKQGKLIEEQSKEFYDVFDDAFLHIYPNFVSEVNKLLRPEEQIVLREGEKLNTDLRIIAFMRLGIEESTRIAQMLNYSVYTIYTYRNKLKNRAISRETFESDIMKIKSVS
ncbi:MAG: DUF6377 domain-containing protein [Bacteroides sp.]|nr:DUF6377 domain-containing protein [Bacteroides sp.]